MLSEPLCANMPVATDGFPPRRRLLKRAFRDRPRSIARTATATKVTSSRTAVQQHAQTFFAQTEEATGVGLPRFVKDEFDAFLECGTSWRTASCVYAAATAATTSCWVFWR